MIDEHDEPAVEYTDRPVESQEVLSARSKWVWAVLGEVRQDLVSWALARGFGEDIQPHADRAYRRLEALRKHDLTLAVALLMQAGAEAEAKHLTQMFWESTPKDYR